MAESIIINHPFVDGNKRTGFSAMYALLLNYNYELTASKGEAYQFVISISTGELHFEGIVDWLQKNASEV